MNNQQRIRTVGLRSHGGYMPEGSTDDCFAPEQRIGSVCDQLCIQGIPQGTSAAARSSRAVEIVSNCHAHSPAQIRNVFLSHQQSFGIAGIPDLSMAIERQEMTSLDNKVTACRWGAAIFWSVKAPTTTGSARVSFRKIRNFDAS